jgi:hypothetical protein
MANSLKTNPDMFLKQATGQLPKEDLLALEQGRYGSWVLADARETFRSGVRGAAREAELFARPWGFRLEQIRVPVYLWQGEKDQNAPPVIGHYLARTIPGCEARFVPDKAHYSLLFDYAEEALCKLVEQVWSNPAARSGENDVSPAGGPASRRSEVHFAARRQAVPFTATSLQRGNCHQTVASSSCPPPKVADETLLIRSF